MALSVPSLPPEILNTTWRTSRKADKPKINAAVNSIKCTIASMCGIHIHTMSGMKKADIEIECESKYHVIVTIEVSLSQCVRKPCVNSYNGHWIGTLHNGIPTPGRS